MARTSQIYDYGLRITSYEAEIFQNYCIFRFSFEWLVTVFMPAAPVGRRIWMFASYRQIVAAINIIRKFATLVSYIYC